MLDIVEYNTKRELVKINPDKSELPTLGCMHSIEVTLDGAPIGTVTSVKHLGIDRTAKITVDPDVRIKIEQRTVYAALGPGLHARRGLSPKISFHVWKMYVIQRFLYGIEVQVLSSTNLRKLEAFQKKILRHLQGLPERSSNASVYTLIEAEPIELVIERNRMAPFLNIARLPGSVEYQVLHRQLAMSNPDRYSFSTSIREILHKYNLSPPEDLLQNPRQNINGRPHSEMQQQITGRAHGRMSYQYNLLQSTYKCNLHPHNLWAATDPKPHEVRRAELKARLLTGTYILQCNTARFNRNEVLYLLPASCATWVTKPGSIYF
ncbi:hypothetical protein DPMN_009233 [Dreissena polymorpha]|uniref:Uncharacterized protein n=1 Tax=Dreissena polymorpha TaxID=45954 RepID=A0A9D4RZV7_DREPO|nr:hypothetical protein DPMN_009233 [Dreissena polymorpha]